MAPHTYFQQVIGRFQPDWNENKKKLTRKAENKKKFTRLEKNGKKFISLKIKTDF